MKHKILFAFLALVTSFSLVSCGDDDKDNDPKPSKATYKDTGSELIITYPLTDDNDKFIGTCKETVSYKDETIISYTILASCNSAADAEKVYKEALEEKNDPESDFIDVKKEGNNVIITCEIPDDIDIEMLRIMLQIQVAEENGDKELEKKLEDELNELIFGELRVD